MADKSDPPRKSYGFKEREFQRDNAPVSEAGAMPTAKELAMMSGAPTSPRPSAPAGPKAGDPNDVYAVLQGNRVQEQKAGLDAVEIRQVKSRRARDFWLILVGGNAAIIGTIAATQVNPVTVIFGLAGILIFSLGLSWVMWQVMDKY